MKIFIATACAALLTTAAFAQEASESSTTGEKDRYTSMFTQADSDKDNYLDSTEGQAIGLTGASFASLDSDSDGKLSLDEFLALISAGQDAE